jgi:hypothetical protein
VLAPQDYADDRLFVYLRLADDNSLDAAVTALKDADQPVIQIQLDQKYDLCAEFLRWEMAVARRRYTKSRSSA